MFYETNMVLQNILQIQYDCGDIFCIIPHNNVMNMNNVLTLL